MLNNNEPRSYGEAMVGPDSDKWLESMKFERGSMYENKVWTLEELLDGRKTVKYIWIFKRKRDDDGEKSPLRKLDLWRRVVSQVQGVDYNEIFSSVAMLKVRRNHVSICCIYEIWQMDVKTSFLTSFRKERLYSIQSEKFCRS